MKEIEEKNRFPKYFIISDEIIAAIRSDELKPGMRIPSEREIINRYGVSNTTARKALQQVESAGLATRIKGRGTFVRQKELVRSATRILSFTRNMIEAGYTPSSKVLHKGIVTEGYSAAINGRVYTMKGPVLKIHRLRFADEIPMMLEVRYISLELCPGIEKEDFAGSLYAIYEHKYKRRLTEIHQMLSTIMLESGIREFFDFREPAPGILVDGVTFCGKEIILEMESSIYRGDKYHFAVRAK